MASASTRGLRSRPSRFSSPARIVEKEPEGKAPDAPAAKTVQKTFLDRWVEPPLRPPAPSFEDTKGLERVGVLEHMAPLGQPPSQKLLQKLKLGSYRPSLRTTLGHPEEVVTPTTEVEQIESPTPADVQMGSGSVQSQEATPMSSPDHRSTCKQGTGEMSPRVEATPSPMKASFTPSVSASPYNGASSRKWTADRMNRQIENAIAEAQQAGALNLVPGFRMIHRDALTDPRLWTVLEAVLNKSTSQDQFKTFKRYIKRGIKQYRTSTSGENFPSFQGPPYPLVPRVGGVSPSSFFQNIDNPPASSQNQAPSITSPYRLKPSPAIVQHRSSPVKTSRSPSSTLAGSAVASGNGRPSGAQAGLHASPSRCRSHSVSSSSSLSSAKSIPESFAPGVEAESEAQINGARPVRSSGQRQAANRVAAGHRSRPSATIPPLPKHPFSDFNTTAKIAAKRLKKTREDIDMDHAEIEKRRRDLELQSFVDYNDIPRPEINDRTVLESDHSHPISLSVRVPPPVVHAHPLVPTQAALSSPISALAPPEQSQLNGTGRKRPYNEVDQDDTDIPTSLSSSPAPLLVPPPPPGAVGSSRAVTPRAAKLPPPAKRKSARVMVS
jgi:hypothetical protein